mgnify:CR=1 FL=1
MYTDPLMYGILPPLNTTGATMAKFIDRTGQRFGKLVAIERKGVNELKKVLWRCICDCGKETLVPSGSLVTGNTTSCGCVAPNFKHGGWKKSSYNTWRAMMRRCYNPKSKDYKRYGAEGITVCAEWHDYIKFAADMGEPEGTQTLDRIDPYGHYNKENCRWTSISVQNRNVRTRKESKSGYTGVHLRGNKWYAEITYKKHKYYSKACTNVISAAAARKELEQKYWGEQV